MAFVAALAAALSVLLMIWAAPAAVSWRLQTVESGVADHACEPACGISVMLSSIIASLQAGAALEPALERAFDSVFPERRCATCATPLRPATGMPSVCMPYAMARATWM